MLFRRIILCLSIVLLSACGKQELPSPFHASDVSHALTQADFHMTDHNGHESSFPPAPSSAVVRAGCDPAPVPGVAAH